MLLKNKRGAIDEFHFHVKFTADVPIDCLRFYRYVRKFFPYQMDVVFNRMQYDKQKALTGYLRLPLGTMKLDKIVFETITIWLEEISKLGFEKCLSKIPLKVYFKGFPEFATIDDIKRFFNKYGKLKSLTQFELSHNGDGILEHQGYASFANAIEPEKLLSKRDQLKYKGRAIIVDAYTRKEIKKSLVKESTYSNKVHYFESSDEESKAGFEKWHNCAPKLVFDSIETKLKNHAFSGYYIRPYMRSLSLINRNLEDNLNIRINILPPHRPTTEIESRDVQDEKTKNL